MTIKQFQAKTMYMNPDAILYWLMPDGTQVELEHVWNPANEDGRVVMRGAATQHEIREVADKVRSAIANSRLGRED